MIVLDVKGTVHRLTVERRRQMGQQVHVIDMRDGHGSTGSLNLLDIARRCGTDGVVQNPAFLGGSYWVPGW